MEQNVRLEPLDVSIAIGFLDQGLDLIIEPFDRPVCDPVSKVCKDVIKVPLTLASNLLDRVQT